MKSSVDSVIGWFTFIFQRVFDNALFLYLKIICSPPLCFNQSCSFLFFEV